MTNRPHVFVISSSDDRRLAAMLMAQESVSGVELGANGIQVRANDFGAFTRAVAKVARAEDIRLTGVLPSDESLEDVFSYLVAQ
jgi:ABC-2 type transport system ATP-binding protein